MTPFITVIVLMMMFTNFVFALLWLKAEKTLRDVLNEWRKSDLRKARKIIDIARKFDRDPTGPHFVN